VVIFFLTVGLGSEDMGVVVFMMVINPAGSICMNEI
jgi:hypothetical protein